MITKENKMQALEKSIAHWEANARATTLGDIKLGTDHCALCHAYYSNDCQGCPVNARTGQAYCVGSPYNAVHHAAERFEDNPTPETWGAYRRAAQAELDFLKSLRTP